MNGLKILSISAGLFNLIVASIQIAFQNHGFAALHIGLFVMNLVIPFLFED